MADEQRKSKFGLGLLIGTIIGGLAAFFFSPGSGEENRKMAEKKLKELRKLLKDADVEKKAKEIFGEASSKAVHIYLQAKEWLIEELAVLKEAVENIDKEKYTKAVEKVVRRVQKEVKKDAKELEKLKKQLMKEWEKLKK
jgi:gas vesicle protein